MVIADISFNGEHNVTDELYAVLSPESFATKVIGVAKVTAGAVPVGMSPGVTG